MPGVRGDAARVSKVTLTLSTIRQQPCYDPPCSKLRVQHNRSCPPRNAVALLPSASVWRCQLIVFVSGPLGENEVSDIHSKIGNDNVTVRILCLIENVFGSASTRYRT